MGNEPWDGRKAFCYRCGHLWIVRSDKKPRICPRCRSARYDVRIEKNHTCEFCGMQWVMGAQDEPCPRCGKRVFDTLDARKHHCNQCDHVWAARTDDLPLKCPVCKSAKWNEPKVPQFLCKKCGHVWTNSRGIPSRCPRCQSVKWNEMAIKLECRRCGYKWTSNSGKGSNEVKTCPSCRSKKWNEPPAVRYCSKCGSVFVPQTTGTVCPKCAYRGERGASERECGFCGTKWIVSENNAVICPRCGLIISGSSTTDSDQQVILWTNGRLKLTYLFKDEVGCVYLWNGAVPESACYVEELLRRYNLNIKSFIGRAGHPEHDGFWSEIAEDFRRHRDDYKSNIEYFMKRLGLSSFDAEILALHFIGMCQEGISLKKGLPLKEVRASFDVIQTAYEDSGIVVNDSIFTEDPIALYDRSENRE